MRIVCLGGGPAGLYFSIMLKKASQLDGVTVSERNQPEHTLGWGVGLSDASL